MKAIVLLAFACLAAAQNQPPAATPPPPAAAPRIPDLPDSTVVATFDDGTQFTVGDFRRFYFVLPPENQQMALRDREAFLKQWALLRKLSAMAEKQKLDQKHPNSDALEYYRMTILSQAMINEVVNNVEVKPEDIAKYYEENKSQYKQARVKAIYIGFSANPVAVGGKTPLTEAQAKAKAVKLVADIRAGADFVQLVKQHSEDESKSRDGDFATLRPADNIPDAIKTAVFALKQGQITDAVRQPNGFYIFRAEDVSARAFEQVRDEIFNLLKQKAYADWLDKTNKEAKVTYQSPAFIGLTAPPVPPKK